MAYSGPVSFAFALLVIFTVFFRVFRSERLQRVFRYVAAFLLNRGLFRTPLEPERAKVDLLRILTGVVLLDRTFHTSLFLLTSQDPLAAKIACVLVLILAAAFALGFMTPVVSLVLLYCNVLIFDQEMRTYTLGSDVLSMLLLVFAFAPAGTRFSLDAIIVQRDLAGARMIRSIYAFVGSPTNLRLILAKSAALLSYSMLCLYSVLLHIGESSWLSGDVGVHILASSYWTKPFLFFRELFDRSDLAVELARLAMRGMVVWYLLLLPCVLIGGWPRRIIITWSLLFFAVSTFILQLGWLGYYEFIFLALLFWDRAFMNRAGRRTLEILYDDRCNLCDRTVRILLALDIFRVLQFRPLSKNIGLAHAVGLSEAEALRDLYGYDRRRNGLYSGYGLYAELSKRLLLLVILAPLLLLGRWTGVGPLLYRIIADRRRRWFGVCNLAVDYDRSRLVETPLSNIRTRRGEWPTALFSAFLVIHTALWPVFVAILPFSPVTLPEFAIRVAHAYGFMRINVFNAQDLQTTTHWFTISALDDRGKPALIPFTGVSGERLSWHRSDRAYFGNSLVWRRALNTGKEVCYSEFDDAYLADLVSWYRWNHPEVNRYLVEYYYEPALEVRHDKKPIVVRSQPRKVCTAVLDKDGKLMSLDQP